MSEREAKAWSPSAAREAARADLARALRRVGRDKAAPCDPKAIDTLAFTLAADRAFDDVDTFRLFVRVLAGSGATSLRAYLEGFP